MRISISSQLCLLLILVLPISSFAEGFQTYSQEVSFLKTMLDCPHEKFVPPMKVFGALYICTLGKAETVQLFVSAKPDSDRVLNIGLLWNDWKINGVNEVHSDLKEADKALNFLIDMYVPARRNEIKEAFWDSLNDDFDTSEFLIFLTHKAGLQKNERLMVLEEK